MISQIHSCLVELEIGVISIPAQISSKNYTFRDKQNVL